MGSTFIAYTLENIKASPAWTMPPYGQIICSCEAGTRSIAVGKLSRCDHIPSSSFIIQRGPVGTLIVVDSGTDICSYLLRADESGSEYHTTSLSSLPESLCVIPFTTCTVMGTDAYVYNNSGGVLTIMWMGSSIYMTITIYGRHDTFAKTVDNLHLVQNCSRQFYPTVVAEPRKDDPQQNSEAAQVLSKSVPGFIEYVGANPTDTLHEHTPPILDKFPHISGEDILIEALREADLRMEDSQCSPVNYPSPMPYGFTEDSCLLESVKIYP